MQIQIPALACGLLASLVFANSNDNKPKFTIEISGNDDPECYFQTEDFCVSAPGGSSTDPRTQSEPFGKYDKSTETCTFDKKDMLDVCQVDTEEEKDPNSLRGVLISGGKDGASASISAANGPDIFSCSFGPLKLGASCELDNDKDIRASASSSTNVPVPTSSAAV